MDEQLNNKKMEEEEEEVGEDFYLSKEEKQKKIEERKKRKKEREAKISKNLMIKEIIKLMKDDNITTFDSIDLVELYKKEDQKNIDATVIEIVKNALINKNAIKRLVYSAMKNNIVFEDLKKITNYNLLSDEDIYQLCCQSNYVHYIDAINGCSHFDERTALKYKIALIKDDTKLSMINEYIEKFGEDDFIKEQKILC